MAGAIAESAPSPLPGRGAALGLLAILACTPTSHRLAPYRDDATRAAALEARAAERCAEQREVAGLAGDLPPHPFTTDGCSAWPDAGWVDCCVEHDIAYWCGGTSEQRREADALFRSCVASDHGAGWARSMYWGVRAGGSAWWPLPWRWGYGWSWPHGYDTAAQDAEPASR